MDNPPNSEATESDLSESTLSDKYVDSRIVKIGNTTFEITHHYVGTRTYEEVVRDVIKREAESR